MKTVFDSSFKYRPAIETDVRKTFERIRRELQAQRNRAAPAANSDEALKVIQLEPSSGRLPAKSPRSG
jgi:hypothetical protein